MKKSRRIKEKKEQKDIAREHITELFHRAGEIFSKDQKLSDKYVHIARSIAMKFKLRLHPELKRRFCKHCYSFLVPGENCRVRTHEGKVVYTCNNCKKFMRFPYKKEKKKTKR